MITTTNLKLDTVRPNINPLVWAKVGDQNSRYVVIAVTENGIAKAIPSTATVSLSMQRSDGAINSVIGTVTENGYAQIILPQWLTSLSGLCQACLKVSESNEVLHTLNFQIYIEESSSPDKQIIWINYQSPLSVGTYYLIHNEASLSFTTKTILPVGGIVVLNSNLTVTTYEDQSATLPIDIDLPIVNDSVGTFLPTETLIGQLCQDATAFLPTETLIGQLCQDATATANDIQSGKTAYGPNGKIVGTAGGNKLPAVVDGSIEHIYAADLAGITIVKAALKNLSHLKTLEIPEGVTEIEREAFVGSSFIETATFPTTLTTVGTNWLYQQFALVSLTFYSPTPLVLPDSVSLPRQTAYLIYVPAQSVDLYKSATNWANYADKIRAIPT